MAAGTLDRILEAVRTLSDAEKLRLREALDSSLGEGTQLRARTILPEER